MKFIIGLLVVLMAPIYSLAQDDFLLKVGILDMHVGGHLEGSVVSIIWNGKEETYPLEKGNRDVETILKFDFLYSIKCSHPDYASKTILLDLRNIPEESKEGGFKLDLDVTLFILRPEFNNSIMNEPLGMGKFNQEVDDILFDYEYTSERNEIISKELERVFSNL